MKLQYPFLLCLCLALAIYFSKKQDQQLALQNYKPLSNYKLVVNRGAFHYDRFIVTVDKIVYIPLTDSNHIKAKYNKLSEVLPNDQETKSFFDKIESEGFFKLKNIYEATSSCTSKLEVSIELNGKIKSVSCDDFERDCPELVKYINQKVVELEGNDLKRIYLTG